MVAASTAASSTFTASGTAARSVGSEELNSTPARALASDARAATLIPATPRARSTARWTGAISPSYDGVCPWRSRTLARAAIVEVPIIRLGRSPSPIRLANR